ncbi:hypothetical protein HDU98_004280 [Podochytrium sp. JEL0797]|nr:hypothetical protein HDU98_004280 [Podochytrium sp. JEL0797]
MSDFEVSVDPAGVAVSSIHTSPTHDDLPISPDRSSTLSPQRIRTSESQSDLLRSLDELDLDGERETGLDRSVGFAEFAVVEELGSVSEARDEDTPPAPFLDDSEVALLRRDKQTLANAVEALQRSLAAKTEQIEQRDERRIEEVAQWEKDFAEYEENRMRVALLEEDLALRDAHILSLETELNSKKFKTIPSYASVANPSSRRSSLTDPTTVSHVQAQIQSLESQLEAATSDTLLAQTYSREMTEIVEIANAENARISADLDTCKTSLSHAMTKLESLQSENSRLLKKIASLKLHSSPHSDSDRRVARQQQLELESLQTRLLELENSVSMAVSDKVLAESDLIECKDRIDEQSASIRSLEAQLVSLSYENEALREAAKAVGDRDELRTQNSHLQLRVDELSASLDKSMQEHSMIFQLYSAKDDSLKSLQQQHDTLTDRLAQLERSCDNSTSEAANLQSLLDVERGNNKRLVDERDGMQASLTRLTDDIKTRDQQFETFSNQLAETLRDEGHLSGSADVKGVRNLLELVAEAVAKWKSTTKRHEVELAALQAELQKSKLEGVAQLEEKDSKVLELQQQLLSVHYLANSASNANHNAALSALTIDKSRLEAQVEALQLEVVGLQDDCIQFSDVNEAMEEQVQDLENVIKELKEHQEELKQSLAQAVEKGLADEREVGMLESIVKECVGMLVSEDSEAMMVLGGVGVARRDDYFASIRAGLDRARQLEAPIAQIMERHSWPGYTRPVSVSLATILECLDLHLAQHQTARDADTLSLLRLELETHHRMSDDHARLLARVKEVEAQTAQRLREAEGREVGIVREVEEMSRCVREWEGRGRVWEGRERELCDCVERLEASLFRVGRELNGSGGGVLDEVFGDVLDTLERQKWEKDAVLEEREGRVQMLEDEIGLLKEVEDEKVRYLEMSLWDLVREICDPDTLLNLDQGIAELKDALFYFKSMNVRLSAWRGDLIFQKRYFELWIADLLASQRLLIQQVGGGGGGSGAEDAGELVLGWKGAPRRRWRRAFLNGAEWGHVDSLSDIISPTLGDKIIAEMRFIVSRCLCLRRLSNNTRAATAIETTIAAKNTTRAAIPPLEILDAEEVSLEAKSPVGRDSVVERLRLVEVEERVCTAVAVKLGKAPVAGEPDSEMKSGVEAVGELGNAWSEESGCPSDSL